MQHVSTLTTCSSFTATYVAVYSSNNVCMHPYLSSTHVNKYVHTCVRACLYFLWPSLCYFAHLLIWPHTTPPLLMSLLHCLIQPFHFSCHFSTASYDPSTSHVTSPLPHTTLPLLMSLLHCLIQPLHFSCHFSTVSFTLAAHHTQAGRPSCSSKDQSLQLLLQERLQVPLQRTYPTTA